MKKINKFTLITFLLFNIATCVSQTVDDFIGKWKCIANYIISDKQEVVSGVTGGILTIKSNGRYLDNYGDSGDWNITDDFKLRLVLIDESGKPYRIFRLNENGYLDFYSFGSDNESEQLAKPHFLEKFKKIY